MHRPIYPLIIISLITGCSNTASLDEQVVANSQSHPKVSQQPALDNSEEIKPGNPKYRPIRNTAIENVQLPNGSLFNPRRAIGLYQPRDNYHVGDMILVKVTENTSANKSLNYKTNKKGEFDLQPVTLNAGSIKVGDNDLSANFEQSKDFDSSAQTKQKNSLEGDITVYVVEVLNNGNIIVAGEKWITLNTGQEFIRFSGEIRISDISPDNTIASIKIGNSHIEYSGIGDMQNNQEASLLGKFFGIFD